MTALITVELDIKGYELSVMVDFEIYNYEENYREDIDGNRGQKTTFIEIEKLRIRDFMNNDITDKIAKKYPEQYNVAMDAALDYAEENV